MSTTVVSLGAKLNLGLFDFDLYGGQVSTPSFTYYEINAELSTADGVNKHSEKWTTMVAYARYKMENPRIHPFVKLSHDSCVIDDKDNCRFTRYSAGAEWFPASEHFWLHAVYVGQNDLFHKVDDDDGIVQKKNARHVSKYIVGVGSSY